MTITFEVKNQIIKRVFNNDIIANSINYLQLDFKFTGDWNDKEKLISFKHGKESVSTGLTNDSVMVPFEVIKTPGFTFSLLGIKDEVTITTNAVMVVVNNSGYEAGAYPQDPPKAIYEGLTGGDQGQILLKNNEEAFNYEWHYLEDSNYSATETLKDKLDNLVGKAVSEIKYENHSLIYIKEDNEYSIVDVYNIDEIDTFNEDLNKSIQDTKKALNDEISSTKSELKGELEILKEKVEEPLENKIYSKPNEIIALSDDEEFEYREYNEETDKDWFDNQEIIKFRFKENTFDLFENFPNVDHNYEKDIVLQSRIYGNVKVYLFTINDVWYNTNFNSTEKQNCIWYIDEEKSSTPPDIEIDRSIRYSEEWLNALKTQLVYLPTPKPEVEMTLKEKFNEVDKKIEAVKESVNYGSYKLKYNEIDKGQGDYELELQQEKVQGSQIDTEFTILTINAPKESPRESTLSLKTFDTSNKVYFVDISEMTYEDNPEMVIRSQSRGGGTPAPIKFQFNDGSGVSSPVEITNEKTKITNTLTDGTNDVSVKELKDTVDYKINPITIAGVEYTNIVEAIKALNENKVNLITFELTIDTNKWTTSGIPDEYSSFTYRATLYNEKLKGAEKVYCVFNVEQATSGNYCPVQEIDNEIGSITFYSNDNSSTIKINVDVLAR